MIDFCFNDDTLRTNNETYDHNTWAKLAPSTIITHKTWTNVRSLPFNFVELNHWNEYLFYTERRFELFGWDLGVEQNESNSGLAENVVWDGPFHEQVPVVLVYEPSVNMTELKLSVPSQVIEKTNVCAKTNDLVK